MGHKFRNLKTNELENLKTNKLKQLNELKNLRT